MKEAVTIRRADKKANCDTDLQAIGFVFSDEEMDAVIAAEDTLDFVVISGHSVFIRG
jgi:hypothetical protein